MIILLRILVFLCIFGQALHLSGQEEVVITGQILNDTIDKSELNVVNLGLKIGAITDRNGQFKIKAHLNDTINISGVQYESRQIVINSTIYRRKRISFYLIPKINELEEIQLSNISLTGNLKQDVLASKIKPQITAATLGLPVNARPIMTPEERRYYGATGGAGPLGALINAISGRTKMLKKHLKIAELHAKIIKNREKFSDSLYMKEFNIPKMLIEDFVYYVFEDKQAIRAIDQENLLELLDLMLSKSGAYLKTKEDEQAINKIIKD